MPSIELVALDCETTGLAPERHDRVVEVAVVFLNGDLTLGREYSSLVNPQRDLGPTHIHGVKGRDVASAPLFVDVADDLVHWLGGRVIIGHNIGFDLRFLRAEFGRLGLPIPEKLSTIDTMRLANGSSLADACDQLGVGYDDRHTALGDARAAANLFLAFAKSAIDGNTLHLDELGCQGPPPPLGEWPRLAYLPTEHRRVQRTNRGDGQDNMHVTLQHGMSICFTGQPGVEVDGERMTRAQAEALASLAGLVVRKSVVKKLDLLVAQDIDSLSGKAQKARQYGIPIVSEAAFWRAIGFEVDR
jgi:DNA polymerase-3 subunit epsilon